MIKSLKNYIKRKNDQNKFLEEKDFLKALKKYRMMFGDTSNADRLQYPRIFL